jgi:hypothetical protein
LKPVLNVACCTLGAADRLSHRRRGLTGASLTEQTTGFAHSLNRNRDGLAVLGRGRGDPTHKTSDLDAGAC